MATSSKGTTTTLKIGSEVSDARKLNAKLKRQLDELKALKAKSESKEEKKDKKDEKKVEKKEEKKEEKKMSKEEIKEAFQAFDTDKSGFIEWEEFQFLSLQLGAPLSEKEVKAAIATFDTDGDGKVSFDEFYNWFTKPKPSGTGAGVATAAILQAKLALWKSEAAFAKLRRTHSSESKKSTSGDCNHSISFNVGSFGKPMAASTYSLEFKHVADPAFVSSCQADEPMAFFSVDLRMVSGRASADEHKKFWERMLLPLLNGPSLPRDFRGIRINVQTVMDVVRLTLMIPNPSTYGKLCERRAEREDHARRLKEATDRGASDEVSSIKGSAPPPDDKDILEDAKNPLDDLIKFGIDFQKFVKKASIRSEIAFNWDTLLASIETLSVLDLYKLRVRADLVYDPALIPALLEAAKALEVPDRTQRKLERLLFATALKNNHFQLAFGDVKPVFRAFIDGSRPGYTDADFKKDVDEAEDGSRLAERAVMELLFKPIKWAARTLADSVTGRSEYDYRDLAGALSAVKIFSSLLAKDVQEIGAFHVRSKHGLGVSLTVENGLTFPQIADLVRDIKLKPPRDYRGYGY